MTNNSYLLIDFDWHGSAPLLNKTVIYYKKFNPIIYLYTIKIIPDLLQKDKRQDNLPFWPKTLLNDP